MLGHGGSSAGSYLADPTSPIPSTVLSLSCFKVWQCINCVTSTVRVKLMLSILFPANKCSACSTSGNMFSTLPVEPVPSMLLTSKRYCSEKSCNLEVLYLSQTWSSVTYITVYCAPPFNLGDLSLCVQHSLARSSTFIAVNIRYIVLWKLYLVEFYE